MRWQSNFVLLWFLNEVVKMRSTLNDGYSCSRPALAWQKLRELIEQLESKQERVEQGLLEASVRISKIENRIYNGGGKL